MKIIGYCPDCHVAITEDELEHNCSKCSRFIIREDLSLQPAKPAASQSKEQGRFARSRNEQVGKDKRKERAA